MQTVYIGNTLVNDVMLGSQRMDDVLQINLTPIKSGLQAIWEGNYNATTSSWKAWIGNYTASSFVGVKLTTGSGITPYYSITSSLPSFQWGSASDIDSAGQNGNGARTVLLWINPTSLTQQSLITWYGRNSGGVSEGDVQLVITSAANQNKLAITGSQYGTFIVSSGSAANLNSVVTGSWQMVGFTTDGGNTMAAFEVWLNNTKQALTGSGQWTVKTDVGNAFWEAGLVSGLKPYSGSIAYHLVYNRKLTDSEILQNYQYIQNTFFQ